ncbi:FadR/GntR family transcriptional regulator [Microbacterium dextranolyticum]|uniref:GntR family transcriptional regulator n=1 Tax=Microbacterium dextranolyticum TaxID=36806 RepID=A0A9W6M5B0_9MICO|nr:FadR/GntR family transcriptional regulator [Microbacterium dextranolyticum]MBM7462327.1 DNA-binding FadR family transcriptional regulator [Microbacterium dextranolyticum]GLJ94577.1 GntR family transcriptional regulator [Microbacterium dextranolyticum]
MTDSPPARAWRVVLESIEGDLLEGRLGPGDRLPPERELASTLGVGRSSVREALRVLEVMGLIRTGTGSGPTAGAIVTATPHGGLAQLLRLQVAAHGFPIPDVYETRLLLEEWAVARLAGQPDADLSAVHAALDAMEADGLSINDFLALDSQFHVRLAEASGNVVVSATMAGLRETIESYIRGGAGRIVDWEATAARLRREHADIVTAIERGDNESAQRLLRAHITGYYSDAGLPTPSPI